MQSMSVRARFVCVRLAAVFVTAALLATSFVLIGSPSASAQQPTVALVTRLIPAPGSDDAYVEHLTERGWDVTLIDDDQINEEGASAVDGFDLVVISSSVYPERITWRLRNVTTPVIVAEHQLFKAFHFTSYGEGQIGFTTASRKVNIVDPTSPLVGGLSGEPTVAIKAKPMNWGLVAPSAHVAAVAKDDPSQAVLFSFDVGDELASGNPARGRRVGIYMSQTLPKLSNADGWKIFDAAAAWASPVAPPPPEPPTYDPIEPESGAHLGANVSKGDSPTRYEAVLEVENQIGRKFAIINRFHEFSSGLTTSFFWDRQHIEDGRTVMISWRATDNPGSLLGEPDPNRAAKIVDGQFDAEISAMAIGLRDLQAPVLLRFNWEMDQDVGDNQNIGTPEEFIAAWRYVHDMFAELNVQNVEWVWSPRAASFNKDVGPTYYPGDEYVDWVGGSAVPINSYRDPVTIYSDWNDWASSQANPKPQLLWIGLRENPDDASWKADFIDDLDNLVSGPWGNVKALVYYHADSPKGYPYWIDTSSQSLTQFRQMACNPHFETTFSC